MPKSYVSWAEGDSEGRERALASLRYESDTGVVHRARGSNIYLNVAPRDVSIRDEFSREDYEDFRPGEALPIRPKDKIKASMRAYSKHGLVKNIIDLMADFACAGIDLNHPDKPTEIFCKEWFRRVNGVERSERFLNTFYRCANVIVRRITGYIPLGEARQMKRATAEVVKTTPDIDTRDKVVYSPSKREIPWRYYFFNPLSVDLVDDELATFVGEEGYLFGLRVPESLARKIVYPKGAPEEELIKRMPPEVVEAVRRGERFLLLDPARVRAFYYKKDDWQAWAEPMLCPVLTNLNQLEKMQLADMAALDGAISSIRVWKLGDVKERIFPTADEIQRLAEILANNVGGGVMDFVYGPHIDLVETKTDIHQFLGSSKYEPVLNLINQGLGIPPSFGNSSQGSPGFTNNYFSLKTLIERLQYGRNALKAFWEGEVALLGKAMEFDPPAVVFDRMSLDDEAAEKKLLLDLADRDLISWEYLVERFGANPEIEAVRIKREAAARKAKEIPPKAGPYHDAQQEFALKKIFTQSGAYSPSEMGVELEEKKAGESTPKDEDIRVSREAPPKAAPTGVSGQGRPKLSKDVRKRKKREVKPRRSAGFIRDLVVAERMYGEISRQLAEAFLARLGKANLRQLTDEETEQLEHLKGATLWQFPFGATVDGESLQRVMNQPYRTDSLAEEVYSSAVAQWTKTHGDAPPLEVSRRFRTSVYAMFKGESQNGEN